MKIDRYPNTWFNPTKAELDTARVQAPIAFDMDGVLSETGMILEEAIKKEYGVTEVRGTSEDYPTFQYVIPGVSRNKVFNSINRIVHEESMAALPSPWMQPVLSHLLNSLVSFPITIVTARAQENAGVTYRWLEDHIPGRFNLIMVNGMQKEVVLKRIGTEVFVDDRYKTIRTLTNHITMPILYRRPWNQGRPTEASAFQINDLRDIIPVINMVSSQRFMEWPRDIPYPNRMGEKGRYSDLYA